MASSVNSIQFPPWLCMKYSYFMLILLILGPQALGKDIDVFLRLLIDVLEDSVGG